MSLRAVPERVDEPLPFDEANAEFNAHWTAARKAYADMLNAAGGLAYPLYVQGGNIGRVRIDMAQHEADRISKHAREVAAEISACRDTYDRATTSAHQEPTP